MVVLPSDKINNNNNGLSNKPPRLVEILDKKAQEKENSSGLDKIKALKGDLLRVVENFKDPNQKNSVNGALKKLDECFQNYLKEKFTFSPLHRRPGSIGLNIEDIEHLLFDQKATKSEGHKMIKNFIGSHLLNLNQNIPVRSNTKNSSNAAILHESD